MFGNRPLSGGLFHLSVCDIKIPSQTWKPLGKYVNRAAIRFSS